MPRPASRHARVSADVLDVRWYQYVAAARRDRTRLRIVSEGDSWFAFSITGPALDGAVADHARGPVLLLDLATNGATAREMFEPPGLNLLTTVLKRAQAARVPPQLLLVSAGGNDLLGNLGSLLRPAGGATDPDAWLDAAALATRLSALRRYLAKALALRDAHAPNAAVAFHSYAYPTRLGVEGFLGAGPWISPAFAANGPRDRATQEAVCRRVLDRFHDDVLLPLVLGTTRAAAVDLRRGLARLRPEKAWYDEIHPSPRGYQALAALHVPVLAGWFPAHWREADRA